MKSKINSFIFSPAVILSISLLILFIIGVYPFGVLITKILFSESEFSLKYFQNIFHSKTTILAIKNTVIASLLTGLFSSLMAIPLSWLFTRTNLFYKNKWRSIFCLPYAIPPYVGAIAWIILANPSNGILNNIFGIKLFNIYTMTGLVWCMSTFFFTFVLLSLLASLDRMDPSLEEAARLSGAGPFKVFKDITLPIIFPSLMSGFVLVVLASAASFGVPALIGTPANIYLMTTRIYTFQKMGSISSMYQGGALSIILLVFAILILIINQKVLQKSRFETVSGKTARPNVIELGKWNKWIFLGLIVIFSILFLFPLLGIIFTALSKVQGKFELSNLGFQNFYRLFFETNETPIAFWNSFRLAFIAATCATFLGLILSFIQWKTKVKGRSFVELFASLPYSTPGTVLGLAMILAFSHNFLGTGISLYNTLTLIGIAYIAKYLNFAVRTTGDGFGQIDDVLAEAARVSGASWFITLKTIWFPLMKPALVASWFLVFMPTFSELTMTILLTGPGLETLGTLLFQLQEYADASGGGSSVLALIVISFVTLMNIFVKILSKGKYGL